MRDCFQKISNERMLWQNVGFGISKSIATSRHERSFFLSCLSCRVLRRPYRAYSGAVVCRCMFSTDPDAYPRIRNCDRDPLTGAECKRVWKNLDFLPISPFITEMIQQSHGRWIGNCTQAFEWCYFEWSWVTLDPHFKVTILFNIR